MPFHYRGRVIGIEAYERALESDLRGVRELGQANREQFADPESNSRPRVWYDHCNDDVNPYEVSFSFLFCNFEMGNSPHFCSLVLAPIGSGTSQQNLMSAP